MQVWDPTHAQAPIRVFLIAHFLRVAVMRAADDTARRWQIDGARACPGWIRTGQRAVPDLASAIGAGRQSSPMPCSVLTPARADARGIPTARASQWHASTVGRVKKRASDRPTAPTWAA